MKTLVIIDGKSVFYRGYFAMGALSTSDGTPTSGVYGFATIATEIVKKLQPTKVVVAWDKAKTSTAKRLAIYPEYKAGRTKPPEDFFAQIPLLKELIFALGWEFLEADEYEADDIIGTLARQADEKGDYMTYIVSSDLDMLQIVDENTRMYRLIKGFSNIEEIDVSAIEKKYGILKNQFLDLKALKGDNSDNMPGVPGIGEKTAVKLLNEYGSLRGIYKHIDEISGAIKKKLEEGKESAEMSYELAKILTDAPVQLDETKDLTIEPERIVAALKKLEFNSLIRKIVPSAYQDLKYVVKVDLWMELIVSVSELIRKNYNLKQGNVWYSTGHMSNPVYKIELTPENHIIIYDSEIEYMEYKLNGIWLYVDNYAKPDLFIFDLSSCPKFEFSNHTDIVRVNVNDGQYYITSKEYECGTFERDGNRIAVSDKLSVAYRYEEDVFLAIGEQFSKVILPIGDEKLIELNNYNRTEVNDYKVKKIFDI